MTRTTTHPIPAFTPYPCRRCGRPGRLDQVCPCPDEGTRRLRHGLFVGLGLSTVLWGAIVGLLWWLW